MMGKPDAITILTLAEHIRDVGLQQWLMERKNSRQIPHRLEKVGYVSVRNDTAEDGLWRVTYVRRVKVEQSGMSPARYEDTATRVKRQVIYAKKTLTPNEQIAAARALAAEKQPLIYTDAF